jgi:hypothetical protein
MRGSLSLSEVLTALAVLFFLDRLGLFASVLFNSPWQRLCALFTLDGRCDMSLKKYSANTRERCK